MSPRVGPRPADLRYRVVVTRISKDSAEVTFEHTGAAYVVAVADLSGARVTATVDHDGDQLLRERLVVYITDAVHRP